MGSSSGTFPTTSNGSRSSRLGTPLSWGARRLNLSSATLKASHSRGVPTLSSHGMLNGSTKALSLFLHSKKQSRRGESSTKKKSTSAAAPKYMSKRSRISTSSTSRSSTTQRKPIHSSHRTPTPSQKKYLRKSASGTD